VLRAHPRGAGVGEQEVAGAVGVLRLAGFEAHLPDGGGVLIAENAGDRDARPHRGAVGGHAERIRRRAGRDRREHLSRNIEQGKEVVVPVERVEVAEHGAAGVRDVGDVNAAVDAAGQVPQQPGVGSAEQGVAGVGGPS